MLGRLTLKLDTVAYIYVGLHFQKLSYHCCEGIANESTCPIIYMKMVYSEMFAQVNAK